MQLISYTDVTYILTTATNMRMICRVRYKLIHGPRSGVSKMVNARRSFSSARGIQPSWQVPSLASK